MSVVYLWGGMSLCRGVTVLPETGDEVLISGNRY